MFDLGTSGFSDLLDIVSRDPVTRDLSSQLMGGLIASGSQESVLPSADVVEHDDVDPLAVASRAVPADVVPAVLPVVDPLVVEPDAGLHDAAPDVSPAASSGRLIVDEDRSSPEPSVHDEDETDTLPDEIEAESSVGEVPPGPGN